MYFRHHLEGIGLGHGLAIGVPGSLLVWLFVSICLNLIIQKTGRKPGCLVWIPILQLIPAMETARMGMLWLLLFLIPGLGAIVFFVLLGAGLARARKKDSLWGLAFVFPCAAPIALLYLALA